MIKLVSSFMACLFLCQTVVTAAPIYAGGTVFVPLPQQIIEPSLSFIPPVLKGMRFNPNAPLDFNFILDTGDADLSQEKLEQTFDQLLRYYLAALTIPQEELWVNLSPYEQDRIVTPDFGATQMGQDLLAQDYLLKQITASLLHPDNKEGQRFWQKLFDRLYQETGQTHIDTNMFHKLWIAPDFAHIVVQDNQVWITESRLKVLHEYDYLARRESKREENDHEMIPDGRRSSLLNNETLSSEIMRETLIPIIEEEINHGAQFAPLRQIYHAMVLAVWMKQRIRHIQALPSTHSFWSNDYIDQGKTSGLRLHHDHSVEQIYQQYLSSAKEGVYSLIKEERVPESAELIPRMYVAGGGDFLNINNAIKRVSPGNDLNHADGVFIEGVGRFNDVSMTTSENGFLRHGIKLGLKHFATSDDRDFRNFTAYSPELAFNDINDKKTRVAVVRLTGLPVERFEIASDMFKSNTGGRIEGYVIHKKLEGKAKKSKRKVEEEVFFVMLYDHDTQQIAFFNPNDFSTSYIKVESDVPENLAEYDFYNNFFKSLNMNLNDDTDSVEDKTDDVEINNTKKDIPLNLKEATKKHFDRFDLIDHYPEEDILKMSFFSGGSPILMLLFEDLPDNVTRVQQALNLINTDQDDVVIKFLRDTLNPDNYVSVIFNLSKKRVTFVYALTPDQPEMYTPLNTVPKNPNDIPAIKAFLAEAKINVKLELANSDRGETTSDTSETNALAAEPESSPETETSEPSDEEAAVADESDVDSEPEAESSAGEIEVDIDQEEAFDTENEAARAVVLSEEEPDNSDIEASTSDVLSEATELRLVTLEMLLGQQLNIHESLDSLLAWVQNANNWELVQRLADSSGGSGFNITQMMFNPALDKQGPILMFLDFFGVYRINKKFVFYDDKDNIVLVKAIVDDKNPDRFVLIFVHFGLKKVFLYSIEDNVFEQYPFPNLDPNPSRNDVDDWMRKPLIRKFWENRGHPFEFFKELNNVAVIKPEEDEPERRIVGEIEQEGVESVASDAVEIETKGRA